MDLKKEHLYHEFIQREQEFLRADYNPEIEFYSYVKSGDVNNVKSLLTEKLSEKKGLGTLSDNPIQSLKYHFAITAAMLARYCIEGGMPLSDSYSLSDFYIKKADKLKKADELSELHFSMCLDYTKRMKNLRKKKITSMPVAKVVDYIYDNLNKRITLTDLAAYVNLNPSYLSRLFKQETGFTVSEYIRSRKLATAQNMLIYSELSSAEISSILAFPSQSYFTEIFRKEFGTTPTEFRISHMFESGLGRNSK
ncbi:MAG: AraC family transcriptional regulator [Lachnospiraceae bacterium]|nr:AraC family transcriptional regulator [Lachnospiraceae bacterium]